VGGTIGIKGNHACMIDRDSGVEIKLILLHCTSSGEATLHSSELDFFAPNLCSEELLRKSHAKATGL
jgi:hypothetical protein